MQHPHVRSIALDIIVTVLTCGLFNFYVQYKQIQAVNDILKEEKYSFVFWLILTICTCGLYHIYHEYRKSVDLAAKLNKDAGMAGIISVILTMIGLSIVNDAVQQVEINAYYGNTSL